MSALECWLNSWQLLILCVHSVVRTAHSKQVLMSQDRQIGTLWYQLKMQCESSTGPGPVTIYATNEGGGICRPRAPTY
jgi:hypothetical protein